MGTTLPLPYIVSTYFFNHQTVFTFWMAYVFGRTQPNIKPEKNSFWSVAKIFKFIAAISSNKRGVYTEQPVPQ
jgi:hypothetical protein